LLNKAAAPGDKKRADTFLAVLRAIASALNAAYGTPLLMLVIRFHAYHRFLYERLILREAPESSPEIFSSFPSCASPVYG
jgi:hypothetical protein